MLKTEVNGMNSHKVLMAIALIALVTADCPAQSVPKLINYQGKLTDAANNILPNGTYGVAFRVWNKKSSGEAGNILIWGQEYSVNILNGIFNVILGASGGAPITNAAVNDLSFAFNEAERFIGLTVTRGTNGSIITNATEIVPRQQILSTPYAITASFASTAQNLVNGTPPGSIMPFAGSMVPSGWLICNGGVVSRTTYSNLFTAIGAIYGSGDGSTTFNLPDYRGRTLVGVDSGQPEFDTIGKAGGEKAHTLTISEMPSHNHSKQSWRGGYNSGGDWMWAWNAGNGNTGPQYTDNTGGEQPHNNLQPYRTVNYLIKN